MRPVDVRNRREALYAPLREEGIFTWDWMYGEEYALADLHLIPASFRDELATATAALGRIFTKVTPVLQQADDALLLELGVPQQALQTVRTAVLLKLPTAIGRFDFAETQAGLKMLECNSDTPTGIVEAFYVNEHACRFFGVNNPNAGMDVQLRHAFAKLLQAYRDMGYPIEHVWFSSLDWHEEDKGTTLYLMERRRSLPGLRRWKSCASGRTDCTCRTATACFPSMCCTVCMRWKSSQTSGTKTATRQASTSWR